MKTDDKLKVGDSVRLKSGWPVMTVVYCGDYSAVNCCWFTTVAIVEKGTHFETLWGPKQVGDFKEETLERV